MFDDLPSSLGASILSMVRMCIQYATEANFIYIRRFTAENGTPTQGPCKRQGLRGESNISITYPVLSTRPLLLDTDSPSTEESVQLPVLLPGPNFLSTH